MLGPIFEYAQSALVASNDGRLYIERERRDGPDGAEWVYLVLDTKNDNEELIATYNGSIADAYVAGYDHLEWLNREEAKHRDYGSPVLPPPAA